MKTYSSREMAKIIGADGWYLVSHNGTSHQQYKHPNQKGSRNNPSSEERIRP